MRRAWLVAWCVGAGLVALHLSLVGSAHGADTVRDGLRLLRITPEGKNVPPGRELVFQFDRAMVPLGRMERRAEEVPISIEPALACQWRWLSPSALACQLSEQAAMVAATRYRITVSPDFRALDGTTLGRQVTHSFVTQRPKVVSHWFKTWLSPGTPEVGVSFDQPVTAASVVQHLYFTLADGSRLAVNAVPAPDHPARQAYLVRPAIDLPSDSAVQLHVEPGVRAADGRLPGDEARVLVAFHTFGEFRFLGVRCETNAGESITIAAASATAESPRCNPLADVALVFSSPVTVEELKKALVVTPDLAGGRTDYDPWANSWTGSRLDRPHDQGEDYGVSLPEVLKAYHMYSVKAPANTLKDEFGRPLVADIAMTFATDHRRPNYHLEHEFAVLEKAVETHVPVVVTNLEQVVVDFSTLTTAGLSGNLQKTLSIPRAPDIAFRYPLKARDWLNGNSGVVKGQLQTRPVVEQRPKLFFAEVTPFHVHLKVGHYNSLVWVTSLASGAPVVGAQVEIYAGRRDTLTAQPEPLGRAETNADGVAMLPGTSVLDPKLTRLDSWEPSKPILWVRVRSGTDLAVLPLQWDFQVDAVAGSDDGYISDYLQPRYAHIRAWGTTAQGIYRAGDVVQFKLYVRDQDNLGFVEPPRDGYLLQVMDPAGKVVYERRDVRLSEFGAYDGDLPIPANGAVGWYRFELSAKFTKEKWEPMRVLVSDFTPAAFKVRVALNGDLFHSGEMVRVETQATLHAGGPYAGAHSRVTATLEPRPLQPSNPLVQGFTFDAQGEDEAVPSETVFQAEATLSQRGLHTDELRLGEGKILYGRLTVESAVRDDRGKYVAGRTQARYAGRNRFVGIAQKDWLWQVGRAARIEALVVDPAGHLVSKKPIQIKVEQQRTTAARVRGAGDAYLTHYQHEWVEVRVCHVKTGEYRQGPGTTLAAPPPPVCEFTPKAPGVYRITATTRDTRGRAHSTTIERYAAGKGEVLWEGTPGYKLKILPEKTEYHVGDTARYLVQNPFPGARALITVERLGVQRSWVKTLASSTEVIEVPVTPDSLPGFYLSVVVMSPRVERPVEGGVDLGKPAFRIGYVRVPVTDPYKELAVEVHPRAPVYRPRDRATVDLQVRTRQGEVVPTELAVVVLDEAVLDLLAGGRAYYDPYRGFYYLGDLDVRNYNLLKQLVGMIKFENKGANAGGDGAAQLGMRSLFKFVAYWNPTLQPDAEGRATIDFPLPDNLTAWRVLVLAVTARDRMGLGDARLQVNQPTELRPALPNQVTSGDRFEARFTVMNRTQKARRLEVQVRAEGPIEPGESATAVIDAEPYRRYSVMLPVRTSAPGVVRLVASAGDASDQDRMEAAVTVVPKLAMETVAAYGSSASDDTVRVPIAFPSDMKADRGGLSVTFAPTLIGGLDGAFRFMRDYPYACWEQILSKGVMASRYRALRDYLTSDLSWPQAAELPRQTLERAASFQAPNGGMSFYVPQDRYVSPYLSAYTALAFDWLRKDGQRVPTQVEQRLHGYLQALLRQDIMPDFYSRGMAATVRAVALAALAEAGVTTRDDIERYRRHFPQMSLFGKAHYLLAALHTSGAEELSAEAQTAILASAEERSGQLTFAEERDSAGRRILESPLRTQCAVLDALVTAAAPGKAGGGGLAAKLVRTITQRREGTDHWQNTQENLFCTNALQAYHRVYEKAKPSVVVHAELDGEQLGKATFRSLRDPAVVVSHPVAQADPGRQAVLSLRRKGSGRVYYATRLDFAPRALRTEPVDAGIEIRREYSVERGGHWVPLEQPAAVRVGDLVRVDLYLSLPGARDYLVVDDPVPGALEPVNRELETASRVDAAKGDAAAASAAGGTSRFPGDDWEDLGATLWGFYHKELRHSSARFYSEYLPGGNYHLSYVAQVIAPGEFTALPARAEEMYNPEVFGLGAPGEMRVEETSDGSARGAKAP